MLTAISSWVIFCLLGEGALSARRHAATESCREMVAHASRRWQVFSSPNFPNKFSAQTQCNWVVKAPTGYRVRLQFKSFYLIGATDFKGCTRQSVKITDLFTNIVDGPYCGNTPPPIAISSGRAMRVVLESNAVNVLAMYKGFEVSYTMTTRLPSHRFRDSAGRWRRYRLSSQGFTLPPQTLSRTAPQPTRNSMEVDRNNNAAIDARNHAANQRNNKQNVDVNERNNNKMYEQGVNVPSIVDKGNGPLWRPPVRPRRPKQKQPVQPKPPSVRTKTENERDRRKEKSVSLPPSTIAGIVLGVLACTAIVLVIAYKKYTKRRKPKSQSTFNSKSAKPPHSSEAVKMSKKRNQPQVNRPKPLPQAAQTPTRGEVRRAARHSEDKRNHHRTKADSRHSAKRCRSRERRHRRR